MKIKVDVISGFLGAGKTTVIKKLLEEDLLTQKVVVIENEFGQVSIDNSILRMKNVELKDINSGCICCSISDDFKSSIEQVVEIYKPDRIIIEPSGVGKLSDVLRTIKDTPLRNSINMIVTVVDILKYDSYVINFDEFYKNQILNANTILLTRTEKADNALMKRVVDKIRAYNKTADIITTPINLLSASVIIDTAERSRKQQLINKVNLIKPQSPSINIYREGAHSADKIFETWGNEVLSSYDIRELKNILGRIGDKSMFGDVIRAKGIVRSKDKYWYQFDYVPSEYNIREASPDYIGRICVIGRNLNNEKLNKLFNI